MIQSLKKIYKKILLWILLRKLRALFMGFITRKSTLIHRAIIFTNDCFPIYLNSNFLVNLSIVFY
jgi:hypothetical protein